jgi:hypothetical protein
MLSGLTWGIAYNSTHLVQSNEFCLAIYFESNFNCSIKNLFTITTGLEMFQTWMESLSLAWASVGYRTWMKN